MKFSFVFLSHRHSHHLIISAWKSWQKFLVAKEGEKKMAERMFCFSWQFMMGFCAYANENITQVELNTHTQTPMQTTSDN